MCLAEIRSFRVSCHISRQNRETTDSKMSNTAEWIDSSFTYQARKFKGKVPLPPFIEKIFCGRELCTPLEDDGSHDLRGYTIELECRHPGSVDFPPIAHDRIVTGPW